MNSRTLIGLLAALAILVALAVAVSLSDRKAPENTGLLFPALKAGLNDVGRIVVRTAGNKTAATLERRDGQWVVVERAGYPADLGKIRKNLIALGEARILEEKTSNPELYGKLGVEDIDKPSATGVQLDLTAGEKVTSVIVGNTGVGGGDRAYVRRTGEKPSWMVAAALSVPHDGADWLDRSVLGIAANRIQAVTFTGADGTVLRVEKPDRAAADFQVLNVPSGRQLSFPGAANALGGALADVSLESVQPAGEFSPGEVKPSVARFEAFDGLVVEARSYRMPDGVRVRFSASADEALFRRFAPQAAAPGEKPATPQPAAAAADKLPTFADVQAEATQLNSRLANWVYTLPDFKAEQFSKHMADLLQPLPTDRKPGLTIAPKRSPLPAAK